MKKLTVTYTLGGEDEARASLFAIDSLVRRLMRPGFTLHRDYEHDTWEVRDAFGNLVGKAEIT